MPRRDDIETVAVIGSGPIVIGQACEFDYSGTQALRVLREEGYRTVLVNSNPATIMTDPGWADRTYLEPLDVQGVRSVLELERPDALLPTLGGQTALNLASRLSEDGTLEELGIELIGASYEAIRCAEDRQLFGETMERIGLRVPHSAIAHSLQEARAALAAGTLALPAVIRPAFTLGGQGGGFAADHQAFEEIVARGLRASPIGQVLIEESVAGWGEFELEVIRDRNDNVVIICSIENVDPMGVHTGDSVTVAPAQTLSDREYQVLRDASAAVIRAVGVETGGSNVQFALNRETGELVVIEMNPRVSRSSALASKATGYPIAKVATKLAVGYTLDEIPNDITGTTPASFEPTLDYVVIKLPRFAFEKFPGADDSLTTHMKSVGEVMGIGRSFNEAWGKAMRSRELDGTPRTTGSVADAVWDRFDTIQGRLLEGESAEVLARESGVHRWFLDEWAAVAEAERSVRGVDPASLDAGEWRRLKRLGIGDGRIETLTGRDQREVRRIRKAAGVRPVFKAVDSCAAEVVARAPYYYSAYEDEDELDRGDRESVIILGAGPNRIGQGIEFDYCCVQAAQTLRRLGYDAVMVNCNPETVSTDADSSDRLYFEPLTVEDVLEVIERERPLGVVAQFGGQTPLRLARRLEEEGVPLLGTPFEAIDIAEDRERFGGVLRQLGLEAPAWGIAGDVDDAVRIAGEIGYPVLVRPSYVLGGRAMRICYDEASLRSRPVEPSSLVDRFVEDAIEVDVDAVCDGTRTWIGAVMQHVEEAGVHSGDSACVIPTLSLGEELERQIRAQTAAIAEALGVRGLINVQFAVQGSQIYVIEANPRASRTVPFVAKATGVAMVEAACRAALGLPVDLEEVSPDHVSVKAAVLPFSRFSGADPTLGPEMRSTGEVMGIGPDFPTAFAKGERAAGRPLPSEGRVFLSVRDADKPAATMLAALLQSLGFDLVATAGTARALRRIGIPVEGVLKVTEGSPNVVDMIRSGGINLVINTPFGRGARTDGYEIRESAIRHNIPCITTLAGASAAVQAIAQAKTVPPVPLQDLHAAPVVEESHVVG
ncbi:MAG TPA: carbamoyl-phosphate synthase large subunit [Gaiellales bacterium]|nr:carbamoyl-phosphate synthase large subunit [Gaiellales bacterium]